MLYPNGFYPCENLCLGGKNGFKHPKIHGKSPANGRTPGKTEL